MNQEESNATKVFGSRVKLRMARAVGVSVSAMGGHIAKRANVRNLFIETCVKVSRTLAQGATC